MDKLEYMKIACVFTSFPLISTIQHTDLHPGNMIFMKVNGVLKLGIIDFGMFVVNTPAIQKALFSLTELFIHQRDDSSNYVKHFSVVYEPVLKWEQLAEPQYRRLNVLAKQMTDDMISGNLTESHIRNMFVKVKQVLPDIQMKINIDMVKILLGNTMVCATVFSLTNDIQLIGELQQRVFKEIIS
jgi:predicted unusual protein kinase regulating ubiquinone biosynthesis (AarF/ABC1/UbiB family)